MDLSVIEISPEEAVEKLAEYEQTIWAERTAEDRDIRRGYWHARLGRKIISMSQTIQAGGYHSDSGMPKLAVVRADAITCYAHWDVNDMVFVDYPYEGTIQNRGALVGDHSVRVPLQRPAGARYTGYWESAQAIVPLIPPRFRPPKNLHRLHILWEAEWSRIPPKDPALLRHIRGDLWAVLAEWDLTELERYALSQRR